MSEYSFHDLLLQVQQISAGRDSPVPLYDPELQVFGRLETRRPSDGYLYDGMRRGADPNHPYLVFQYTLDGWGSFSTKGVTHALHPGMAFTAVIPSEHVYALPPNSSEWTFLWLIIRHPYIVERISRRQQESGPILTLPPNSPLILRALDLFSDACRPAPHDPIRYERSLFEFFWEHERATSQSLAPQGAGARLLDTVRHFVLANLERPMTVADLAKHHGMSRSAFSQMFKATTNRGPAQFILQIRLEEAVRRLLNTQESVASVASETGFANANHFCRVFRQHFHLSPGAFRRQMR